MRALLKGLGLGLCALFMMTLMGCEPSGDSNTAKLDSLPPTGANGGPPPKTQKEYMEQNQKKPGENPYGASYPGGSGAPGR